MSESADPPDTTTGTAEEIAAQRVVVAALKLKAADRNPIAMREWRRANLHLARLMRSKVKPTSPRNLRVARATVAERIARRATMEAAGILEDSARVLRAGVNVYGKIAAQELAEYYRDRLLNGTPAEKTDAAKNLSAIYNRSLDLLMLNRERAKGTRQAIATWPSEGEKG